jgi:protein-S-isoprenylcysteine O-methyltransferase Ste14
VALERLPAGRLTHRLVKNNTLAQIALAAAIGAVIGGFGRKAHLLPDRDWLTFTRPMLVSLGLWVVFSVYWSIAAKDKAPTKSSESTLSRQLHVIAVNVALLILILPIPGLTLRFVPDSFVLIVAGLVIQTAFIGFAIWARVHLGSNWSGEVRIASGHELVRSGPYRYVRHPIYTALVGMYIGTALVSGQLHALVALALVLLAYWRKIRMEERALAAAFPDDHERYRADTWAWIPGLF